MISKPQRSRRTIIDASGGGFAPLALIVRDGWHSHRASRARPLAVSDIGAQSAAVLLVNMTVSSEFRRSFVIVRGRAASHAAQTARCGKGIPSQEPDHFRPGTNESQSPRLSIASRRKRSATRPRCDPEPRRFNVRFVCEVRKVHETPGVSHLG